VGGILAFKKLILAGLVALFPALKRFFAKKEPDATATNAATAPPATSTPET
jgi:hypothetical protein